MGRDDWPHPASALWRFQDCGPVLAEARSGCQADHGCAPGFDVAERVLGKTVEPRIPSSGVRHDLRSAAQKVGGWRHRFPGIRHVGIGSRSGDLSAGARWLRTAYDVLCRSRSGSSAGAFQIRQTAWPAAWSTWVVVHSSLYCRSRLLAFSSSVCAACHTSFYAGDARTMTASFAERFFDLDLWLAGAGHFLILFASFQVPYQLGWREDLKQLMPFTRKLLWVQAGCTGR